MQSQRQMGCYLSMKNKSLHFSNWSPTPTTYIQPGHPTARGIISKAKVNHITRMPKILPISARMKWKLVALHSDLSFLLFLHSFLLCLLSASQTHQVGFPTQTTCFLLLPPASPRQPPTHPHLSSNTNPSKRPPLNPTLTFFIFTELITVQCPLYLIFAYLNIHLPLVESKTLKGRDSVLFIPVSYNLSRAGTLQECNQQLLINWLTQSKNLRRPH